MSLKKYPKPVLRITWQAWIAALWVVFAVFAYWRRHAVPFEALNNLFFPETLAWPRFPLFLFYIKTLALESSAFLGIWAVGHLILKAIPRRWNTAMERAVFECASGLGVASYAMFLLGALGLYHRPVFWVFFFLTLSALAVVFFSSSERVYLSTLKSEIGLLASSLKRTPFLSAALGTVFLFVFAMTFVPEIFYDSLVYHLGIPHWYLQEGRIFNIPNLHSHLPLTWEMLNLYALGLTGDESMAKFFHFASGILLSLGFFSLAKRTGYDKAGLLAAAIFFSMPMAQLSLWTAGNDIAVSLFVFLSFYALIAFIQSKGEDEKPWPWIFLCGLCAGLAFSIKYTSVCHIPAVMAALAFFLWRERRLRELPCLCALFCLTIFVVFLPWFIKNVHFTGNPIYPVFRSFLGGIGSHPQRLDNGITNANQGFIPKTWIDFLELPWTLTMNEGGSLSFSGPLLLAGASLLWAAFRGLRTESWWWPTMLYAVVHTIFLTFQERLLRYHLPNLSILVFLIAVAWSVLLTSAPAGARRVIKTAMYAGILINILWALVTATYSYDPAPVLMGIETREGYREYTHPGINPYPANAMYQWIAANLPRAKILIVGDEKIYPCPVPFYASGVFDYDLLAQLSEVSSTPEELLKRLKKMGFTHILININEDRRLYGFVGVVEWNPKNLGIMELFWERYVRLAHLLEAPERKFPGSQIPLGLYEIKGLENIREKSPPPWNPILFIYDDYLARTKGWNADRRRRHFEFLHRLWPAVIAFPQHIEELRRQQASKVS